MNNVAKVVEEVIKHLPGKHDQKTHAGGGPALNTSKLSTSGADVDALASDINDFIQSVTETAETDAEANRIARKIMRDFRNYSTHKREQGFVAHFC